MLMKIYSREKDFIDYKRQPGINMKQLVYFSNFLNLAECLKIVSIFATLENRIFLA